MPAAAPRFRRPLLPDLLLAEAVVGARTHGGPARPRHPDRRARHASLLPRELRDARPPGRALRAQPASAAGSDHGRRAAQAGGAEPVGDRPRPLLPRAQGRAAAAGARALRRLDLRYPPRPVAEPRDNAESAVVRALLVLEAAPPRRLGREARLGLHP